MAESAEGTSARRLDVRLVPTALAAWSAALAGTVAPQPWSASICAVLVVGALGLTVSGRKRRRRGMWVRTTSSTLALACVAGAAVALHCALDMAWREQGPLAAAAARNDGVVITVRVTGPPAALSVPGHSGESRWAVPTQVEHFTSQGNTVTDSAAVLVIGGDAWERVQPGQSLRTAGTLGEGKQGQPEAAVLAASTAPVLVADSYDPQQTAARAREQFRKASAWLPPDAAGLLPGMVTGDTSTLPESLESAMKTTGMTHLTAVSGANCSLVLGGFILLARTFRLPRPLAAISGVAGLAAFVVLVGPDPSVLRAAVMGTVGLAALTAGRRGRSLSFLCLASTSLLLLDPGLSVSFGFLLSVLATLGIVLFAGRLASWFPAWVPAWLATGIAVPLSAQFMCGPAIVALQPQFSPYSLAANVLAGPLVAPVTILGTISVPLASVPWLAAAPVAVAGTSAGMVAAVARFFAALPGAAMPWAEGPVGIASMLAFSTVAVLVTWSMLHPAGFRVAVLNFHSNIMKGLESLERPASCRAALRGAGRRHQHLRRGRGRLKPCANPSGRNHQWLLPRTPGPRTSRRTTPDGATPRLPP
ncbi:ComEC/Rec2 family competence protein [Paenarthrobacter sp. NPDC090522]|uniref:ComEC/Rec2 family competence protein n=1 Tax=Paenarthrobacter sp. NPDC090522 TaxID=3364383 RepID=UPI0037F3EC91